MFTLSSLLIYGILYENSYLSEFSPNGLKELCFLLFRDRDVFWTIPNESSSGEIYLNSFSLNSVEALFSPLMSGFLSLFDLFLVPPLVFNLGLILIF